MKQINSLNLETSKAKPHSEQLKVWEAYIEANEVIIEAKEKPIEVSRILETKQEKNRWNEPILTTIIAVEQKKVHDEILNKLVFNQVVPNIEYAKFESSYLQLNNLTKKKLDIVQSVLKDVNTKYSKFTEYNPKPTVWGKINSLKLEYANLSNLLGISTELNEDETIFCTLEEVRNIDKFISKHPYVRREPAIGAVSTIYNYNDSEILKYRLEEKIGPHNFNLIVKTRIDKPEEKFSKVKLTDLTVFIDVINYKRSFEALEVAFEEFGLEREGWSGEFSYWDSSGNLKTIKRTTEQCAESLWLYQRVLNLKYSNLKVEKLSGIFKPKDLDHFLKGNKKYCHQLLREAGFNISHKKHAATLSFDVLNKQELSEKIFLLNELNLIRHNLHSLGDDFKFKVRLSVDNLDLTKIGLSMKSDFKDDIDFEFSQNQLSLNFRYFSESNDFINFYNKLEELVETNAVSIKLNNNDISDPDDIYFNFYFDVNEETQKSIFKEQIDSLAGSDFFWLEEIGNPQINVIKKTKIYLGNLDVRKSNYEQLVFSLPLDSEENKSYSSKIQDLYHSRENLGAITPDLSGDRSKNNYLKEAVEKITKPKKEFGKQPANLKLGEFIFDSSEAKSTDPNALLETEKLISSRLNSTRINPSQIESVAKALQAEDLAILQGPPGSGKTTVISEIIWQTILGKQDSKILLTSESNLAVDNALGRLNNPKSMIVKPLRIGKNVQEEEGKQFHLERIDQWAKADYLEVYLDRDGGNINNNAVQTWLQTIIERSKDSQPEYQNILNKWREGLTAPTFLTKQVFRKAYIQNINVIGNTCSSAGSPDFVASYQRLYNPDISEKEISSYTYCSKKSIPLRYEVASQLKPVEFDAVIMDEASKATPPELLLPLTFGKKSIVIGDHRQLPPSLNEQDFKETLDTIGKFDLAKHWTEKDYQTSQFERLFLNPQLNETLRGSFNLQYRMHPQINEVIKQFYLEDGGLGCGLPIENVNDPDLKNPFSRFHGFSHEGFISPDTHAIWINVDEPELKDGTSRVNESEVDAIRRTLHYLQNSNGFEEFMSFWQKDEDQEIGIISFYGKQMQRLNSLKKEFPKLKLLMKTVDRFQGMERNIIIVSTVRSNKIIELPHQKPSLIRYPENEGYKRNDSLGFAETPQRLNVALSRAKRLLIVVGNSDHFARNKMYSEVINTIKGFSSTQPSFIDYKLLNSYS